jgi:hypothetical protein
VRVTFVLPSYEPRPSGGFKVVYEYANRLAERGHAVTLVHPWTGAGPRGSVSARARRSRFYAQARRGVAWFEFRPGVTYSLVRTLDPDALPDGDALLATGWRTAGIVASAEETKGTGFYLVQSYETWDGPKEEVDSTFRLPLHKVVVAGSRR